MRKTRTDISTVSQWLKANDNYLILMHASPDGDAVGSGYGLCRALMQMGKSVRCACHDPIPARYDYMVEDVASREFKPEHVIAVDLADTKLLGSLQELYADKIELCIDHHVSNRLECPMLLLDGDASAACEVMYRLILDMGCDIDADIAACLYTGIATDPGCFKYSNTSAETHVVAARLIEAGAPYAHINRVMFDTKSRARLEVERMVLDSIEYRFNNRCAMIVVTDEMQNMTTPDDLEGITALSRQIEGVEVGLTFRHRGPDRYKVSVRTSESVDASAICGRLGGGGHVRAAGCEVCLPIDEAKAAVINAVAEEMGIKCKD